MAMLLDRAGLTLGRKPAAGQSFGDGHSPQAGCQDPDAGGEVNLRAVTKRVETTFLNRIFEQAGFLNREELRWWHRQDETFC